jgi:hypothetical protein
MARSGENRCLSLAGIVYVSSGRLGRGIPKERRRSECTNLGASEKLALYFHVELAGEFQSKRDVVVAKTEGDATPVGAGSREIPRRRGSPQPQATMLWHEPGGLAGSCAHLP